MINQIRILDKDLLTEWDQNSLPQFPNNNPTSTTTSCLQNLFGVSAPSKLRDQNSLPQFPNNNPTSTTTSCLQNLFGVSAPSKLMRVQIVLLETTACRNHIYATSVWNQCYMWESNVPMTLQVVHKMLSCLQLVQAVQNTLYQCSMWESHVSMILQAKPADDSAGCAQYSLVSENHPLGQKSHLDMENVKHDCAPSFSK